MEYSKAMEAADLIEAAIQGDREARRFLSEIALFAEDGDPACQEILQLIQNLYEAGKAKGTWPACPHSRRGPSPASPRRSSGTVAGWWFNVPYRSISFDSPLVKLRALYTLGVNL